MDLAKFAAIRLRGVPKKDRDWLLTQLSKSELFKITQILSQLEEKEFAQYLDAVEISSELLFPQQMFHHKSKELMGQESPRFDEDFFSLSRLSDCMLANLFPLASQEESSLIKILGKNRFQTVSTKFKEKRKIPKDILNKFLVIFKNFHGNCDGRDN